MEVERVAFLEHLVSINCQQLVQTPANGVVFVCFCHAGRVEEKHQWNGGGDVSMGPAVSTMGCIAENPGDVVRHSASEKVEG